MLELLEAAQKLAASVGGNEAEEYENGWTLLWVKGVEREGWKNRVMAEFLGWMRRRRSHSLSIPPTRW
jgi:hypothetical protein